MSAPHERYRQRPEGNTIEPFRETTRSYLQRIVPDIVDLKHHIDRYLSESSRFDCSLPMNRAGRKFILAEIWDNFHKIEEAMRQIEELHDSGTQ